MIRIRWKRGHTYDDAKNYIGIIYLHEWNGSPFYWGICDGSVFGGNARQIDGKRCNPRYGSSYRHWIEGCLRHGGSLYVRVPQDLDGKSLQEIESVLIVKYPAIMNSSSKTIPVRHKMMHEGDVPECIRKNGSGEQQL